MLRRTRILAPVTTAALAVPMAVLVPSTSAFAAPSLCKPPADTVPPQVGNVTLSASTINIDGSKASRTFTVTATATDTSGNGTPSGLKAVNVDMGGSHAYGFARLSLASGTSTDGTWTGTITVPKTAHAGAFTVNDVNAEDAAGNSQEYSSYDKTVTSPSDIRLQSGWDTSLTLTGTPVKKPTVKAGTLTSFSLSPKAIDTTKAARRLHVTATFASPVPTHAGVYFQRTSGKGRITYGKQHFVRHGHTWTGTVVVHRWIGDSVDHAWLSANYGPNVKPRYHRYSPRKLKALGGNDTVTVTSGVDHSKPVLTALSYSPTSIDTTGGPETLAVTAKASDTGSGVRSVDVNFGIGSDQVAADAAPAGGLYPYGSLGFAQSGYHSVRLTLHGDTWTGTTTFRRCESIGTWKASVNLVDKANNYSGYSAKKLARLGLPSTLPVTATPGDVEAPYVYGSTASSQFKTITLDFSEGVKNVGASTLSVYPMSPASSRYTASTPVQTWTCSNGTATIDCSGSDGLVTSVTMQLDQSDSSLLPVGSQYQVFANQGFVTTQLTDGVGNPMDWNSSVAEVTGS